MTTALLLSAMMTTQPAPLSRIALGSCYDANRPAPVWRAVVEAKPQAFLFLGDNMYFDVNGSSGDFTKEYQRLRNEPYLKQLLDTIPFYTIWDDHDYGLNDAGEEYPRKKEAQAAFVEFWKVPSDSRRRSGEGTYDSAIVGPEGKRVQMLMLDTRYFRSPLKVTTSGPKTYLPDDSPSKTMLGEAQWKWLASELRKPAEVRIIMTSIQFVAEDHRFEKWANFPLERKKLLELIRDTGAKGVLFASGDRHLAEISMLPDSAVPYPVYDLTASAINRSSTGNRPFEVNRWRAGTLNVGDNFGFIEIDWSLADPKIKLQIRAVDGEMMIQQHVQLSRLAPRTSPR